MVKTELFFDPHTGKTFRRDIGQEGFTEIQKKDISFAGGSGGRTARRTLERLQSQRREAQAKAQAQAKAKAQAEAKARATAKAKKEAEARSVALFEKSLRETRVRIRFQETGKIIKKIRELKELQRINNIRDRGMAHIKSSKERTEKLLKDRIEILEKGIAGSTERRQMLRGEKFKSNGESTLTKSKREAALLGQVVAQTVGQAILGTIALVGLGGRLIKGSIANIKNLPEQNRKLIKAIIDDPKYIMKVTKSSTQKTIRLLKKSPQAIKSGAVKAKVIGKDFVALARVSPTEAVAVIGTEVILFIGSGGTLKAAGKLTTAGASKVSKALPNVVKFPDVPTRFPVKGKGPTKAVFGTEDFQRVIDKTEDVAGEIGRGRANKFLRDFKKRGGKIDRRRELEFVETIQKLTKKKLDNLPEFKKLKRTARLSKPFELRIKKIPTSKLMALRLNKHLKGISLNKNLLIILSKPQKGVRKIKSIRKKVKTKQDSQIRKFKTAVEVSRQLKRARRSRIRSSKGIQTEVFGNSEYAKALVFIDDFVEILAKNRAKKVIISLKKSGTKFGQGQEDEIISRLQRSVISRLHKLHDYKRLKEASRINEPFIIRLRKVGKLKTASQYVKRLSSISTKRINSIIRNLPVLRSVRSGAKKLSPRRIKKRIGVRRLKRKGAKIFRQTNKYRMLKSRPLRKVTLTQLNKAQSRSDANKFIDNFFDEMGRRQKIDISTAQYKRLKNVIKKRVGKAIKTGNKDELAKFRLSIRKLHSDMNKKSSLPAVKISEKVGSSKRFKTIKDFETETPSGRYIEVRQGQQVMLQKLKQPVQQIKQIQVQKQVFKIETVVRKSIDLKPLLKFASLTLANVAIRKLGRRGQAFNKSSSQNVALLVNQDSGIAEDFKTLQNVGQALSPAFNVAQAVAQDFRSKFASRLKTVQTLKKPKKPVRFRLDKKKKTRRLSKAVMGYAFVVKKGNRQIKLDLPPLTLRDVRDIGASKLDKTLRRTGKIVPIGMVRDVAIIPKTVKGYYTKNERKFRTFRQKKGKRFTLTRAFIEKKKFIGDTKSEIKALKKARLKARSSKTRRTRKTKRIKKKRK